MNIKAPQIDWNDFAKVDIRVGTIVTAEVFTEAVKPALKLTIDFGTKIGIKKTSAQITKNYSPKNLVSKQVTAVINFPPKQIANFMSECLILGAVGNDNDVVLLQPERKISNGTKVG